MGGSFGGGAPPLVIDLGGSDVPVAEQVLHLSNVDASIEQQSGSGGAERVRRVDMRGSAPLHPAFKNTGYGKIKLFYPLLDGRSGVARQDWRQVRERFFFSQVGVHQDFV